jgi:hypothetical protein
MSTWRYEEATKTIRSVPENYWIASMDSWDKAVDHKKSARLIAAAPELLRACKAMLEIATRAFPAGLPIDLGTHCEEQDWEAAQTTARAAITKADESEVHHG